MIQKDWPWVWLFFWNKAENCVHFFKSQGRAEGEEGSKMETLRTWGFWGAQPAQSLLKRKQDSFWSWRSTMAKDEAMADAHWLVERACWGAQRQVSRWAVGSQHRQWREWALRAVTPKPLHCLSAVTLYLGEKCADSHPVSGQIELWHRTHHFHSRFHTPCLFYHVSDNSEYFSSHARSYGVSVITLLWPWNTVVFIWPRKLIIEA